MSGRSLLPQRQASPSPAYREDNPARSLGPAIFVGGTALAQVWLFLIMPLIGGAAAGWLFRVRVLSAE